LKRGLFLFAALVVGCALAGAEARGRSTTPGKRVEVVVELKRLPLATAMGLQARRSPGYLHELEAGQAQLERRIAGAIPSAKVRWHYRYVLDALAVVSPADRSTASRLSPASLASTKASSTTRCLTRACR